jgi:hypothetical protein
MESVIITGYIVDASTKAILSLLLSLIEQDA